MNTEPRAASRKIFAGFWRRVAASFLDGCILLIALPFVGSLAELVRETDEPLFSYLLLAAIGLYYAIFESSSLQATPGKMALGIKVVAGDGRRIGFVRALARNAGKIASVLSLGIGLTMAGWTRRRDALHDGIAGCLVVSRNAAPEDVADEAPAETMDMTWGAIVLAAPIPIVAVGLLASSNAIYDNYRMQSRFRQALDEMRPASTAVAMHYKSARKFPESLKALGYEGARTNYVSSIGVRPESGVIFATYRHPSPDLDGKSIYLVPSHGADGEIRWGCYVDRAWIMKYVPARCRQEFEQPK